MKIRTDFVTNSSSSSYIICFARIADEEKASKIIEKFKLKPLAKDEVDEEKNYCGELGAEFCGAIIYDADKILEAHPNDRFIIIEDSIDADYDEYGDPIYSYGFYWNDAIEAITKSNGFEDIRVAEGEGRDG